MRDDLIRRQDAIDALEHEKTYCAAFLDGYTHINVFEKYNAGLTDGIKALINLPPANQKPLKYLGESICIYCMNCDCAGCVNEPTEGVL